MSTSPRVIGAVGALVFLGNLCLGACGLPDDAGGHGATSTATASGVDLGEYPVGDEGDKRIGDKVSISAAYVRPVGVRPSGGELPASEADLHLVVHATGVEGNDLGYGASEFVPGLTVDYEISDRSTEDVRASGTLMSINAYDGPYYGANVALPAAGDYVLTLTVHSPAENGWVLQSDPQTGVKGDFWTKPAVLTWNWDYTPHQW